MQLPTFGVFPLFVKWMIECWKITFFFKSRMLNIKYCWRATFGHFLGWRGLSLALIQLCWGRYAPAGEMTRHPWEFLSNNYLHLSSWRSMRSWNMFIAHAKFLLLSAFFVECAIQTEVEWEGGVATNGRAMQILQHSPPFAKTHQFSSRSICILLFIEGCDVFTICSGFSF